MSLKIGDQAPNFKAKTTVGEIDFHQWIENSWAILFSHPKSFTPVCTTELGYMAGLKKEFDKRNVKIVGLSVDQPEDQNQWLKDIEETQGNSVNYPLICDTDKKVSDLYFQITEKYLQENLDANTSKTLIDESISEIKKNL